MDLKGTVPKKCEEILVDKSPSRLFILVFSVLLGIFVLCGILTGGESIRQTLFVDSHDTFMDFFNSVMYSSDYPYHKYHDIYPPLITLFYGLIGHFTIPWLYPYFGLNSNFIEGDIAFQLRNSQLGLLFFFVFLLIIERATQRRVFMAPIGYIQSDLDLKLLVLYIMDRAAAPITFNQLLELAFCDAGVDYFSLTQAVSHLVETEHLTLELRQVRAGDR